MRPIDELGIPTSIQGVIAARLDRVSRQERRLAGRGRAGAAVERGRRCGRLRSCRKMPCRAALSRSIAPSCWSGSTANCGIRWSSATRWFARSPTIRWSKRSREDIHARVLAAFESDDTWRDDPDALCYHAMRAKDWAKAFNYGRSAAQKCLVRSAYAEAVDYFRTAMNSLDKTPLTRLRETNAIDLRMEARMAFIWSGRVAEWIDLGKEADQRASQIDDVGRRVAAMTVMAGGQNFYGTPTEAVILGEEVVGLAEEFGQSGVAQPCAIQSRPGVFPCRTISRGRADIRASP